MSNTSKDNCKVISWSLYAIVLLAFFLASLFATLHNQTKKSITLKSGCGLSVFGIMYF